MITIKREIIGCLKRGKLEDVWYYDLGEFEFLERGFH